MSKINPIQSRFILAFSAAAFALTMATLVAQGQQPARVLSGPGPGDKHVVDSAGADRGRTVWAAECITCHGTQARGTDRGPNLMRSTVLLRDRSASELGPYVKKHTLQSGRPGTSLTDGQLQDLSHFLHQRLNEILAKGIGFFKPDGVLTGDATAGAAFVNGEGKCTTCHSATAGNLSGIGGRYTPVDLQQRFLFPHTARRTGPGAKVVTVTVTTESGQTLAGELDRMDDFNVSFRDASGTYHSVRRTPGARWVSPSRAPDRGGPGPPTGP